MAVNKYTQHKNDNQMAHTFTSNKTGFLFFFLLIHHNSVSNLDIFAMDVVKTYFA